MSRQGYTGTITEDWVRSKLIAMGYIVEKPIPDRGVDFIVSSPTNPQNSLKVQVKGRGSRQRNKRFRACCQ